MVERVLARLVPFSDKVRALIAANPATTFYAAVAAVVVAVVLA